MKVARKHALAVIEDSAEAIGAECGGKKTGSFGIGCFSFFPTKNITTGEGGMITTDDQKIAAFAKTLGAHGMSKDTYARQKSEKPWLRAATMAGYNFRMSNVLAAIGVEQMKKLEDMNKKRVRHAEYLTAGLSGLPLVLPQAVAGRSHVYQMYIIQAEPKVRDGLFKHLLSSGVAATVFSDPPVHLQPYYQKKYGGRKRDLPGTDRVSASNIVLPMFPQLSKNDLDAIIAAIRSYFPIHGTKK
jgi:perosamine synthetase